jgi:tetratricopeptide (TPR) repeat protein
MNTSIRLSIFLMIAISGCREGNGAPCNIAIGSESFKELQVRDKDCSGCLAAEIDKSLLACPKDSALLHLKFNRALRARNAEEAIRSYEEIVKANASVSDDHANAGYMYRQLGNSELAISSWRLALAEAPDELIRLEVARELISQGSDAEAISILEDVVARTKPTREQGPTQKVSEDAIYDDALMALGAAYKAANDPAKARSAYMSILEVYPDDKKAQAALDSVDSN